MFIATGTKSQVTCVGGNEVEGSYTEVEDGGHENKAKLEEHKDGSCVRVSKSAVQCFPLAASVETRVCDVGLRSAPVVTTLAA